MAYPKGIPPLVVKTDHFDQLDYSRNIKNVGWTTLILDPIIGGLQFSNVLMDGGSGLNLIYQDTIQHMGINSARISQSNTTFKGVIPCPEARCTGSLLLEVNFRSENLTFHIAPFQSGYQAPLGRKAFAHFNAIPHYASLMLKMPGPCGIITVTENIERSLHAEDRAAALVAAH